MNKKPKQQQKPKAVKKARVYDTATSPLSIAKSIAARFGEEIQEDEFFDEEPVLQATKATV